MYYISFSLNLNLSDDGRLTNRQITELAAAIKTDDLDAIAFGYLGISDEQIQEMRDTYKSLHKCKRQIIIMWANNNPGGHQPKVCCTGN